MDNQREINQALCDGETVIAGSGFLARYSEEGKQETSADGGKTWVENWYSFNDPKDWQIYTKHDWREELKGKETLCWVRDDDDEEWEREMIIDYLSGDKYQFKSEVDSYAQCKRLTKAEVKPLMDNAPENPNDY